MPKTLPEGISTAEIAEAIEEAQAVRAANTRPPVGSKAFFTVISVIVGVVLGVGAIVGVVGRAFYVERSEYTLKNMREAEERGALGQTLERLSQSINRQEAAFEKLSDSVQTIKVDMARTYRK